MANLVTLTEIQQMIVLQNQGKSLRLIAELMGRDRGTVERYLCRGCRGTSTVHIVKCRRSKNLAKRK